MQNFPCITVYEFHCGIDRVCHIASMSRARTTWEVCCVGQREPTHDEEQAKSVDMQVDSMHEGYRTPPYLKITKPLIHFVTGDSKDRALPVIADEFAAGMLEDTDDQVLLLK